VVNLENTNVAALDLRVVPEPVELVTVDVSYLSLSRAVAQLDRVEVAPGAELVGLVKPMFELRLPSAPLDAPTLERALRAACGGVEAAGWSVEGSMVSPVAGARGARELLLHARRGPRSGGR
jgi:23S rRNA (cytidine1920-2'-O)/16S rRNA (cytidine1409-2'-O)-methyltransferase